MLKLGVLADSHVHDLTELPKKAVELLEDMDLIVHAGDYTGKELVDKLPKLGKFKGVYGNIDPPSVRKELAEKIKLPDFIEEIEVSGPYLNFRVKLDIILENIFQLRENYGNIRDFIEKDKFMQQKVVVEFLDIATGYREKQFFSTSKIHCQQNPYTFLERKLF